MSESDRGFDDVDPTPVQVEVRRPVPDPDAPRVEWTVVDGRLSIWQVENSDAKLTAENPVQVER